MEHAKIIFYCTAIQGCKSPFRQVAVATRLCTVEPNTSGSSVWYLVHVTLNLEWPLKIWNISAPMLPFYYCLHTVPAPLEALFYRDTKFPAHMKSVICVINYCVTTIAISRSPWNMCAPRFCFNFQATIARRQILLCNHNRYRFLN